MSLLLPRPISSASVFAGLVLLVLGAWGVGSFWDAFGLVGRGLLPFGVLAGGLVMVGAGVRTLRERRGLSPRLEAASPALLGIVCFLMMAAAAAGVDFVWPDSLGAGRVMGYVALGLLSGLVGGMLGLGGGVVHLSGMTLLFGAPFALARGATLINNIFINAAAAVHYGRRGLIRWQATAALLPASLMGVAAGSLLQERLDETSMRRIFAAFVIVITVCIVFDTMHAWRTHTSDGDEQRDTAGAHLVTGGVAGLLSGVLGISGGVVAVPGQTLAAGMPLRSAIANSTFITSLSSALGSALLLVSGSARELGGAEMLTIAVLFIPGNLLGGHLGAMWMEKLPALAVRGMFAVALVAIAVRSWGWGL